MRARAARDPSPREARPDAPPSLGWMPRARCATSSCAGWSAGPSWRMTRTGRRSSRAWAPSPPDRRPARRPAVSLVTQLGLSLAETARHLGVSPSGVAKAVTRADAV